MQIHKRASVEESKKLYKFIQMLKNDSTLDTTQNVNNEQQASNTTRPLLYYWFVSVLANTHV